MHAMIKVYKYFLEKNILSFRKIKNNNKLKRRFSVSKNTEINHLRAKIIFNFIKWIFVLFSVFFNFFVFAANPWISVLDSIAGQDVPVKITGILSNENISFSLIRPNKKIISFIEKSNDQGEIIFDISQIHVQKSGKYELIAKRSRTDYLVAQKNFNIFPSSISAFQSNIKLKKISVPADGKSESEFVINLKDAFGNIIPNKKISVFSSRNEDILVSKKISDKNGQVQGNIKSKTPGVSTIFAIVENTALFQKPEIIFHLTNTKLKNVGASGLGDFLKAQLFDEGAATNPVAYFSVENLENEIKINENSTVKVIARDENGEIINNYLGSIRFSSTDARAKLPADYQFTEQDQGTHTFFLAVAFATAGTQTLSVHDLQNFKISGEKTIQILDAQGTLPVIPEEKSITIITPQPGTLKSARVTISGESSGCNFVKITDGPISLIEELPVDKSGNFVYESPRLADGKHKFQALCAEDTSVASNEVLIEIDRTPPKVMAVEVIPNKEFEKGENFQIKIGSSETLASARCVFQEILTELQLVENRFVGDFVAPNECGDFTMTCTIADLLGNELEEPNAATIKVCPSTIPPDSIEPPPIDNIPPTAISNLYSTSGENKITLFWSPATDDKGITQYRINYGFCGENLNNINITPDSRTQWYIDQLTPCQKYCFQVIALDSDNLESVPSNIIEGTPFCQNPHFSANKTPTSGQQEKNILPLILAFFSGAVFVILWNKKLCSKN